MRSPFSRGVKRAVRGTQAMVSQIIVSVAAAVCVAFITNAYLGGGGDHAASPTLGISTPAASGLPPLVVEEIANVPAGIIPGEEVFPGAPAGVRPEALQQAVAGVPAEHKERRRRFLGIPIPFTSTASGAEVAISGG